MACRLQQKNCSSATDTTETPQGWPLKLTVRRHGRCLHANMARDGGEPQQYALTFTAPPAALLAEATPTCYEAELLLCELSALRLACEARMAAAETPLLLSDADAMRGYLRELQTSCGQPSAIAIKPPATPPAIATELPGQSSADSPMQPACSQHSTAPLPHLTAPPAAVLGAEAHMLCEASLLRELAVLRAAFDARDSERCLTTMGPAPVLTEASVRECLCELRQASASSARAFRAIGGHTLC